VTIVKNDYCVGVKEVAQVMEELASVFESAVIIEHKISPQVTAGLQELGFGIELAWPQAFLFEERPSLSHPGQAVIYRGYVTLRSHTLAPVPDCVASET